MTKPTHNPPGRPKHHDEARTNFSLREQPSIKEAIKASYGSLQKFWDEVIKEKLGIK